MRIRIRIRIWIRNPGGGGSTNLYLPRSLFLSFFLYPSLLLSALPSTFFLLPYISLLSSSSPSLSLFPLENNCYLSSSLPSYLSSFLYIPFFMNQIVTKQTLAITTFSPPLSPPSSSPYLLLISFASNITDYHCSNGGMDLPPPPHNEWGGG